MFIDCDLQNNSGMLHEPPSMDAPEMVTPIPDDRKKVVDVDVSELKALQLESRSSTVGTVSCSSNSEASASSNTPVTQKSCIVEACASPTERRLVVGLKVAFSQIQVRSFFDDEPAEILTSSGRHRELTVEEFEACGGDVFSGKPRLPTNKNENSSSINFRPLGQAARRLKKFFGSKKKKVFSADRPILLDNDLQCTTKPLWQASNRSVSKRSTSTKKAESSTADKTSPAQPKLRRTHSMGELEIFDEATSKELLPQPGRFGSNNISRRERSYSDLQGMADNLALECPTKTDGSSKEPRSKADWSAMVAQSYC